MLPKLSAYNTSSDTMFYITCPKCSVPYEVGLAAFVAAVNHTRGFRCAACDCRFLVTINLPASSNLTQRAADGAVGSGEKVHKHSFFIYNTGEGAYCMGCDMVLDESEIQDLMNDHYNSPRR